MIGTVRNLLSFLKIVHLQGSEDLCLHDKGKQRRSQEAPCHAHATCLWSVGQVALKASVWCWYNVWRVACAMRKLATSYLLFVTCVAENRCLPDPVFCLAIWVLTPLLFWLVSDSGAWEQFREHVSFVEVWDSHRYDQFELRSRRHQKEHNYHIRYTSPSPHNHGIFRWSNCIIGGINCIVSLVNGIMGSINGMLTLCVSPDPALGGADSASFSAPSIT